MQKLLLTALLGCTLAGTVTAQTSRTPRLRQHLQPTAPTTALAQRGGANTRLIGVLKQQYRNNAWLDTLRFTNSRFNPANLPLRQLRENAPTRGAALRPLRQENYQYNAAGKMTSDSTYTFTNGVLNAAPILAYNFTYDSQGRLQQEVVSLRSGGSWQPYGRSTYTYNAQGQNTRILDESYFASSWLADSQELFTYNAQGQVTVDEFQLADVAGTTFSPFSKDLFTYNAQGQRITDVQQQYTNGAYVDTYRVTNTYGATNNLLVSYVVERASTTMTWLPYAQGYVNYDADGNVTLEGSKLYRSGAYADNERYQYTYQRVTAAAAARRLEANLQVYPNPAVGNVTNLAYQLAQAETVTVEVLDALGRVVTVPVAAQRQSAGAHQLTVAANLTAGAYVVRLRVGNRSQSQSLLVR